MRIRGRLINEHVIATRAVYRGSSLLRHRRGRTVSVAEPLTAPTVAAIVDIPEATGRIAGGDHHQWAVMVKVWVLVTPDVLV